MASTAPAYSLAASLGLVVAALGPAGLKAPAIMVLAFIPMYFIAVAYQELNKAEPDCGTTFTWATRAFGPIVGWLGGWGIIAADVIVMANLAQVAGAYSFTFAGELGRLFGLDWSGISDLAESTFWATVAGVIWIAIMTWICYIGIEVSARIQYALLGIEVLVLVVFAIAALGKVLAGKAEKLLAHAEYHLAVAERDRLRHDVGRPAHRLLHLLGLGHRCDLQQGDRRPGKTRAEPPSSRPCCSSSPMPSCPSPPCPSPVWAQKGSVSATRTMPPTSSTPLGRSSSATACSARPA